MIAVNRPCYKYMYKLIGLTSILLLGACSYEEHNLSDNSIIYCSEGVPEAFNPQTVTSGVTIDATSSQLYNRLISYEKNSNKIIPALAKSWHLTKDGKKITFYLRRDVDFHHTKYFTPTRTLNADDVLFSFNRILDKSHPFYMSAGGKFPFFQSVKFNQLIESIEKINDYTVRFSLTRADSTFLANLASDFAVILSQEYAEQLTELNRLNEIDTLPVGTGPFKFKEYRAGSYIKYVPHSQYWNEPSTLEQLIFDITPSDYGRLTKLLANECDIISYPIAHKEIEQRPNLVLDSKTAFNIGYLGFNTIKPPFNQVKVRQAIAHGINKQAILDTVYRGQAESASTILPKPSWAYDESILAHEYSIEKAKTLLKEAGFEDGFEMDLWAMPVQRPYNPDAKTMAKLIQADLQAINIKVNIVSDYEWSKFLALLAEGQHQSVLLGWSADHPDPDNFFTPLLSCASALSGNNRTFWCDTEFDQTINAALQTTDINVRKQHYKKAMNILAEQMPLLPIAHSKRYQARLSNVKGEILNTFGGIDFAKVSKN